jgi:hypothetical protein
MRKPLTYRDLLRLLRAHDSRFDIRPGKGSERVLCLQGRPVTCCLPHHGDGHTIGVGLLTRIERAFKLPRGFFDRRDKRKAAVEIRGADVVGAGRPSSATWESPA